MAVMPAMRAPPFSVCNWRCSSATRSLSLRSRFQAVSETSAASISSVASSLKIFAIS